MKSQYIQNGKLYEKYIWRIGNFSKLDPKKMYSETFFLSGYVWRIIIFPKQNDYYLSIYLDDGGLACVRPKGWSRHAAFKLALANQLNASRTIVNETKHMFNESHARYGFTNFIRWDELCDSSEGFIVNDTCIINVAIERNDVFSLTNCVERDNHLPKETLLGGLVEFRGLGKIEKAFVPLLEEVCLWHPTLLDTQHNRTRMFTEWAFTALGRVLHFLKTKKVKDMNEDACNHLQILWEELETVGFDLSWLEPHFQSAVGMKCYFERAANVRKLKDNVDALKKDLNIAESNLAEAESGFVERDLDAELGYGAP